MLLVTSILDFLFPPRAHEALVARATVESIGAHLKPHAVDEAITSLLPYRTRLVQACIVEAKFKDNTKAQKLLGAVLATYIATWLEEYETPSVSLIPIPLSEARHKERGYNQVERTARHATSLIPCDTTLLVRTRDTVPQTSLGKDARQGNVTGAFSVSGPLDPMRTYIVLDDVMTTGATLRSAMQALEQAGATKILGLTLAH